MIWGILSTFLLVGSIFAKPVNLTGMQLLEKFPELKSRKDNCIKVIEEDESILFPLCLIEGTEDGRVPPLSPALKEKLVDLLEEGVKIDEKAPEFEALQLFRLKKHIDPAIEKLGDFYFKKLNTALYGEKEKGDSAWVETQFVDHSTFFEIYRSQISKNLIESLSSYCIDAEKSHAFIVSAKKEKRMSVRKKNIENLQNIEGEGAKAVSAGYKDWEVCMQAIQNICHQTSFHHKKAKLTINYSSLSAIDDSYDISPDDYYYSRKRSCVIVNYVKTARQTILKITEIQRLINYIDGDPSKGKKDPVLWFSNLSGKKDFKSSGKTIDELTSVTSGEFLDSGFVEEDKKIQEKLEEQCLKNSDLLACEDFLTEDDDNAYTQAAEYALKIEARMEKISKMEVDQLRKFLEEQGYSDERIDQLEKFKDELKNEIIARYRAEKEMLIVQLWENIEGTTLPKKDEAKIKGKIQRIKEEISNRTEEYTQLIHYNNIISGYLTVSGREGDKGKVRNIQSIFRELSDSAYGRDFKNDDMLKTFDALGGKERLEEIKKQLAEAGIANPKETREVEGLSINALNTAVLNYQIEKKEETPVKGWDTNDQDEIAAN